MSDNADELEKLRRLLEYTRESRDAYAATLDRVQYLVDVPTVASYEALAARLTEIRVALEGA